MAESNAWDTVEEILGYSIREWSWDDWDEEIHLTNLALWEISKASMARQPEDT